MRSGRINSRSTTNQPIPAAAAHINSGSDMAMTIGEVIGALRTVISKLTSPTPIGRPIVSVRSIGIRLGSVFER